MKKVIKVEDSKHFKQYDVVNEQNTISLQWFSIDYKAKSEIDKAMEGYGNDHVVIYNNLYHGDNDFVYAHIINQIDEEAYYRLIQSYEFLILGKKEIELPVEE